MDNKKYRLTAKSKDALFYFFRQRLRMITILILLGLLYGFTEAFSIGILFPLLSQIISPGLNLADKGLIISFLFRAAKSIPFVSPIFSALLIFFIAIFLKNVLGYFREVLSLFLGLSLREHCQATLFHRLLHADYRFFLSHRLGDLEYRVVTAPAQMHNLVSIIPDLITEVFKCLLIIYLLFTISAEATFFIIIFGALFLWITRYLASRVSYFTGKRCVQASSDATVYCGQALGGIKVLKVFKAEGFWEGLFNNSSKSFYSLARRNTIFLAMPARLLEMSVLGILCLTVEWLVVRYGDSRMVEIIPSLGVFALALQRVLPSLGSIGRNSMLFMSLLPYGEATYEAMKESYRSSVYSGKMPARFENEILFKGVSLKYDEEEKMALDSITLSLKKNLLIAIVGESGSGKTSIVNLLLKVLEPTNGEILVDGISLKEINTDEWYSQIGYVGQEVFMFNGTIRENLLFGITDKSDREVYRILEMANATEFVERCNKGLDTVIGDHGIKLSGGERQRLAIARALLRKPDILILDEATSEVDNISERLIKDALRKLHKDMTIINVAHRSSTIMEADKIIVLKDGKVVETGNFVELFKDGRYFKKLYETVGNGG